MCICYYLVFLENRFKFQSASCNNCHDELIMSFGIKVITILSIYGVDYPCIIFRISKNEVAFVSKNSDSSEKRIILRYSTINHKIDTEIFQKKKKKKENMEEIL